MEKIAIIGWEEGLAGQISQWIPFKIACYIHPEDKLPKIDLKKIKKRPLKNFSYPTKGKYLKKTIICSKKWPTFLKQKKIRNVLILISDRKKRAKLIEISKKNKFRLPSMIHPSSVIIKNSKLGKGVVIEPLVFVGHKAEIEDGVYLQERASVEHGCFIKKCSTINPGVIITGNCRIGEQSIIHTGSVIKNNVSIGKNSIVGAGSLVLKDIKENKKVFGVPAK